MSRKILPWIRPYPLRVNVNVSESKGVGEIVILPQLIEMKLK
jgi:hypothetical protein